MTESPIAGQSNEKVTILDRFLSFLILFAAWIILDQLIGFLAPSFRRPLLRSAVSAGIWATAMILLSPTFARIFPSLAKKYFSKFKQE